MKSKSQIYIKFLPWNRDVLVSQSVGTVLEAGLGAGLNIHHTCGGHGTCGTCLVEICQGGPLPARDELEAEMAGERGFKEHERLACQIAPIEGLVVRVLNKS